MGLPGGSLRPEGPSKQAGSRLEPPEAARHRAARLGNPVRRRVMTTSAITPAGSYFKRRVFQAIPRTRAITPAGGYFKRSVFQAIPRARVKRVQVAVVTTLALLDTHARGGTLVAVGRRCARVTRLKMSMC
ncbi:hypothetical protein NDU88_005154 [Pleurodeles waltl]|uniref:Uncharacterized protein n=1 Tax=Pleurodeles waltl TaxID=8319 RepID=A0AAV7UL30_PLEWA|nr:hypothetical protein NDU88_005154 [Pleurodeles waltl]